MDPSAVDEGPSGGSDSTDFPWHLGVYDAHCHPTDTLSSLAVIPSMKAQVLVVMATRQEDQALVLEASDSHSLGLEDYKALLQQNTLSSPKIIPSFGWHPWFSHHLYDDLVNSPAYLQNAKGSADFKSIHYNAVLTRPPLDQELLAFLPEPRSLSEYIEEARQSLKQHPLALVGEVGLDKTFRVPAVWTEEQRTARDESLTLGGREGRNLSRHHVQMNHERVVLLAQLRLAGELRRPASVHGVAAHGVLYDTFAEAWKGFERKVVSKAERRRRMDAALAEGGAENEDDESDVDGATSGSSKPIIEGPFPSKICLHSYSGPAEQLKQWLHPSNPAEVWVSFSSVINFPEGTDRAVDSVKVVPENRLLVESDLHTAGPEMDARLETAVRRICQIRGWSLESGIAILGRNWKAFALGV